MTTYLAPSSEGLAFGDICTASFFADIRVSAETRPLFPVKDDNSLLSFQAYRVSERPTRAVLTPGRHVERAVVVSDDCSVLTALGRGAVKARGRIWFAPVRKIESAGRLQEIRQTPNAYGRLLLEADDREPEPWVAELEQAFSAEAAAVRAALESSRETTVLHALVQPILEGLRARWAAAFVRGGPFVARDNADHFVDVLVARGVPETEAQAAGDGAVTLVGASWAFEGSSLEAAGTYRPPDPADPAGAETPSASECALAAQRMIEEASAVADRAAAAIEALRTVRERLTTPGAEPFR